MTPWEIIWNFNWWYFFLLNLTSLLIEFLWMLSFSFVDVSTQTQNLNPQSKIYLIPEFDWNFYKLWNWLFWLLFFDNLINSFLIFAINIFADAVAQVTEVTFTQISSNTRVRICLKRENYEILLWNEYNFLPIDRYMSWIMRETRKWSWKIYSSFHIVIYKNQNIHWSHDMPVNIYLFLKFELFHCQFDEFIFEILPYRIAQSPDIPSKLLMIPFSIATVDDHFS